MSETVIKTCDCRNPYQDKRYGINKRVFNVGKKQAACTGCGKKS